MVKSAGESSCEGSWIVYFVGFGKQTHNFIQRNDRMNECMEFHSFHFPFFSFHIETHSHHANVQQLLTIHQCDSYFSRQRVGKVGECTGIFSKFPNYDNSLRCLPIKTKPKLNYY